MENLNTDNLMRLQVEQLEKEKKELNQRMRVIGKRLDHVERAYRKEERPLLSEDYDVQQANDKAAHEETQKARIENARLTHQQDVETKARLSRMMADYLIRKEMVLSKRGEEFTKKRALAQKKIEEEKAKRRQLVIKEREEERLRKEEEERIAREKAEEERRLEEGKLLYFFSIEPLHQSLIVFSRTPGRGRTNPQRRGGSSRRRRGQEARGGREGTGSTQTTGNRTCGSCGESPSPTDSRRRGGRTRQATCSSPPCCSGSGSG